jgi:aspartate aminotransferase-like enzyme
MRNYPIPMVPGPVSVPPEILAMYQEDYGSGDLERDYLDLYNHTEANLQQILATQNQVAIQTGEGMLALWGALKSCLQPGDRVLSLATGVFGYGIAEMAGQTGAEVRTLGLPYNETLRDWAAVELAIAEFSPKMITVVHCETPSGTLNSLAELGRLKRDHRVPLLYVDAVASIGGTAVLTDEWSIDLCLGASQKCLSAPPGMAFVAVSPAAWDVIEEVNYAGYDALKPFRTAQEQAFFPYTPYWHGLACLNKATEMLLAEGLESSYQRHAQAAATCRAGLAGMGLSLLPAPEAVAAPTVTAAIVPTRYTWEALDAAFRQKGLVVGGSYGPLAGKVFRLGHMGSQADQGLVERALEVIRSVI